MKCHSVRSECQEQLLKCAPRCRRPLVQILPAFSAQQGCFYFTNGERDLLLIASEKLRQSEPGSKLVCFLIWQVTDESQGCGEDIVPDKGILLGTISRHPHLTYTHMHPSANTDRFVHPVVSVCVCQSQVLDILCLGCLVLY